MLKFYKALNFSANELHDHEIQALLEKLYFSRKLEYFQNTKIDFFLINVNKSILQGLLWESFNKIGWIEIAVQSTV